MPFNAPIHYTNRVPERGGIKKGGYIAANYTKEEMQEYNVWAYPYYPSHEDAFTKYIRPRWMSLDKQTGVKFEEVEVYPYQTKEAGISPAIEFANLNIYHERDIVAFFNKYGSPWMPSDKWITRNDSEIQRENKSLMLRLSYPGVWDDSRYSWADLYRVKTEIIFFRHLLQMQTAIKTGDWQKMVEMIIYFCFNLASFYDPSAAQQSYSYTETRRLFEDFRVYYMSQLYPAIRMNHSISFQDAILDFINAVWGDMPGTYLTNPEDRGHAVWRSVKNLVQTLTQHANIEDADIYGKIRIRKEGNLVPSDTGLSLYEIANLARVIYTDVINEALAYISPILTINDKGQMEQSWRITTLCYAMMLDISQSEFSSTAICKCANPDCDNYFVKPSAKSKKIYCSTTCKNVMAQRMRRARNATK